MSYFQTGAITENTRAWVAHNLEQDGVLQAAQRMGLDLATVTDAVLGQADAIAEVDRVTRENKDTNQNQVMALQRYGITLDQSTADALKLRGAVRGLTGDMSDAQAATLREAEAMGEASGATSDLAPATEALAGSLELTADEAETLTGEVDSLDQALKALLDITFGVEEAQDATATAMRRVVEAAKENKGGLDGNSEAALTNRENVRSLIEADFDLINAMAEAGASADDLTTETERLKQKFIDQMVQAGFSEEAVEEYAEAYDLIPSEVSTHVSTPGMTEAERNARNFKRSIDRIPRNVHVNFSHSITAPVGAGRVAFQHGGEIPGSPSAPVDSQLVAATPGEIMIRRSVAQENRAALLALNATGRWPVGMGGGRPGTSGGGMMHIDSVNVTSMTQRFSTKQVLDDLALHGAS